MPVENEANKDLVEKLKILSSKKDVYNLISNEILPFINELLNQVELAKKTGDEFGSILASIYEHIQEIENKTAIYAVDTDFDVVRLEVAKIKNRISLIYASDNFSESRAGDVVSEPEQGKEQSYEDHFDEEIKKLQNLVTISTQEVLRVSALTDLKSGDKQIEIMGTDADEWLAKSRGEIENFIYLFNTVFLVLSNDQTPKTPKQTIEHAKLLNRLKIRFEKNKTLDDLAKKTDELEEVIVIKSLAVQHAEVAEFYKEASAALDINKSMTVPELYSKLVAKIKKVGELRDKSKTAIDLKYDLETRIGKKALQKIEEKDVATNLINMVFNLWSRTLLTEKSIYSELNPVRIPKSFNSYLLDFERKSPSFSGMSLDGLKTGKTAIEKAKTNARNQVDSDESFDILNRLDPRFNEEIQKVWARYSKLIESMIAKIQEYESENNTKKEFGELVTELEKKITDAEKTTNYVVDENEDEIDTTRKEVFFTLSELEKKKYSPLEIAKFKERINEVFYIIYRKQIIKQLEYNENKNIGFGRISWKTVFEDKIVGKMQNIVEERIGFNLTTIDELEKLLKESNGNKTTSYLDQAIKRLVQAKNLSPAQELYVRELIADFSNVQEEYVARKFSNLSWTTLQPHILPTDKTSRNYPPGVSGDNHPMLYVASYLLSGGLKESRFGKGTNRVLQPNARSTIKSHTRHGERDEVISNKTVHGEAFRYFDLWARGRLSFKFDDGGDITTANAHVAENAITICMANFLNEIYGLKGGDAISQNEVLRSWREWWSMTYHGSARAITSANGPDSVYYAHHFDLYNAGYTAAGTSGWDPLVTEMLFTVVDPDTGQKVNPLLFIWGDHPDVAKFKGIIDKIPLPKGYHAMVKRLQEKGYLTPNDETRNREGFASYRFLLSPLMTMPDLDQSKNWEVVRQADGSYKKVYMKDDTSEHFVQQPVLATVFFRNADGKAIRYPSRVENGREIKGKPISLFDYQDKNGEILYEAIEWNKYAEKMHLVVNSLGTNGAKFLNEYLKSKDFLSHLADASHVAALKNDAKYVMMHFPGLGTEIASGAYKDDPDLENLPEIFMNMMIAQLVFVGLIRKSDATKKKEMWTMLQIEEYLFGLVSGSKAISSETAEVIYQAIKGARQVPIKLVKTATKLEEKISARFLRN